MTNQVFDFEVITADEAAEALVEVLDEELEVAAGGLVDLSLYSIDPKDEVYG